ncbi:unnamed protein product, partial [Amoebophrya sp. A25]
QDNVVGAEVGQKQGGRLMYTTTSISGDQKQDSGTGSRTSSSCDSSTLFSSTPDNAGQLHDGPMKRFAATSASI